MKILQIIHKHQNRGAETFTCQLSNHLKNLGHELKIVSLYKGTAKLPYSGKIYDLDASQNSRIFDFKAWKNLSVVINDFKPDVIQANSGDTLKYAVFSKMIFRWENPIIFRNASEVGRYLTSFLHKEVNRFFYSKVDMVISVSRASEFDLLKLFPFLEGRTKVIGIGLEPEINIPEISLKPHDKKHIVHVGGFSFEKNHLGLIRIFNSVIKNLPHVHLHLIGDGELREEVEMIIEKNNLKAHVSMYGYVDNPLSYIKTADLLILPSIIEGLPGVLLEAMFCKTPVIAYDVGGISEIINKDTGILVPKDDEEGFVRNIITALQNQNSSLILNAYNLVLTKFINKNLALEFEKVYQQVRSGIE